jgi:uncharacterized phage-associated protein
MLAKTFPVTQLAAYLQPLLPHQVQEYDQRRILQKSLYHMQAAFFVLTGQMLFVGEFKKYSDGPLEGTSYFAHKDKLLSKEISLEDEHVEFIAKLFIQFLKHKKLDAQKLSDDSHKEGSVWANAIDKGPISLDLYPMTDLEHEWLLMFEHEYGNFLEKKD